MFVCHTASDLCLFAYVSADNDKKSFRFLF